MENLNWACLGRLGACLGASGASWGVSGASLWRLGAYLGRSGASFWLPLAPFGHHFGLILAAWGSHVVSPGEGCRNVSEIPRFLAPFYLMLALKIVKNRIIFSIGISLVF